MTVLVPVIGYDYGDGGLVDSGHTLTHADDSMEQNILACTLVVGSRLLLVWATRGESLDQAPPPGLIINRDTPERHTRRSPRMASIRIGR